ncbi:MAG: hypothetical protein GF331_00785 [Chitinivibrionales bacterium]|nr:hypothetical protein [Chitinivibrionales bacterium]
MELRRDDMGQHGDEVNWVNNIATNGIGRQIQSAMWYTNVGGCAATWVTQYDNPTEGGDCFWNGSPLVDYRTAIGGSSNQIRTTALAMHFGHVGDGSCPNHAVTTRDMPVLSGTEISKFVSIEDGSTVKYDVTYTPAKTAGLDGIGHPVFEPFGLHLNDWFTHLHYLEWDGTTWDELHNAVIARNLPGGGPTEPIFDWDGTQPAYIMASFQSGNAADEYAIALYCPPTVLVGGANFACWVTESATGAPVMNDEESEGCVRLVMREWNRPTTRGTTVTYHGYILMGTIAEIEAAAERIRTGVTP